MLPMSVTRMGHLATFDRQLSEGLAQSPYVAARAGVEPMTLRTKGIDSTNAPHMLHNPLLTLQLGMALLLASI